MAKLSPVFNDQTIDVDGDPAVGYQLFTYVAGSSTKATTYSDEAGTIPNSNPIILNAEGWPTQGPIWLSEGSTYKFVLALPTDTDPPTSPVKTIDDVSGVGDNTVSVSQWVFSGVTPTYVSANSFTLTGDQTTDFHVGRREQFSVSSGTVYGTITASAYTSLTTVTMLMDGSDVLDSGLSGINHSILRADHLAEPFTNVAETIKGTKTFSSSPVVPDPTAAQNPVTLNVAKWVSKGIGEIYEVNDSLGGMDVPPTNSTLFRYIQLAAGLTGVGAYNQGCLTSETTTGSAPLIISTATISLAGSPILGQTIYLENTMRTFSRAGNVGALENDAIQNIIGGGLSQASASPSGAFASSGAAGAYGGSTSSFFTTTFDASRVVRTSNETRSRNIGKTRYMRIK